MKLLVNNIRDDITKSHVGNNITIHDITYFADKRNENNLQDVALWGMILSIKSGMQQSQSKSTSSSFGQGNKRMKIAFNGGKPFNRYIRVADLSNPPNTFAITTAKLGDTSRLLQHTFFDSFLGMSFYLLEPDLTNSHQSFYTHVLACEEEELLPLKWGLRTAKPTPITLPPSVNETFYFILNNEEIKIHRARVVSNPCCRGYQCDRQHKDICLCLHTAALSPITYEFLVELNVNPEDFQGAWTKTCKFRSYRTTSIFFKKFVESSSHSLIPNERKRQTERRLRIEDMVNHINENGGWTVVGWVKRGEISVDGEQEKIDNTDVRIHLTYVFPTDDSIIDSEDFQALQIDCDLDQNDAVLGEA